MMVDVAFSTEKQNARELYLGDVQLAEGHSPRTCDGTLLSPTSPVMTGPCIAVTTDELANALPIRQFLNSSPNGNSVKHPEHGKIK